MLQYFVVQLLKSVMKDPKANKETYFLILYSKEHVVLLTHSSVVKH